MIIEKLFFVQTKEFQIHSDDLKPTNLRNSIGKASKLIETENEHLKILKLYGCDKFTSYVSCFKTICRKKKKSSEIAFEKGKDKFCREFNYI